MSSKLYTSTLNNGLKIIHEHPINDMDITTIHIYVSCGSIHDPPHIRGAAHLIEHMCFKGTSKYKTSAELISIFESEGAYFNAFTEKEHTIYVVKVHKDATTKALEALSQMLFHSNFKPSEYNKEYDVVVQENINATTQYDWLADDAASAVLYKGLPYEYPVDDIAYHPKPYTPFPLTDIEQHYHQYYQPQNMLISIVSVFSHKRIHDIIYSSQFGRPPSANISPINRSTYVVEIIEPRMQPEVVMKSIPKINVANLVIAFSTGRNTLEEKHIFNLLTVILGGTMNSRLFSILRGENGLTYSSSAEYSQYLYFGDFRITATTESQFLINNGNKPGVLKIILSILHDIWKNGISPTEFRNAKKYIYGKHKLSAESSTRQCVYNAEQIVYSTSDSDTIIPYNKLLHQIYDNITMFKIKQLTDKYFNPNKFVVSIVGGNIPKKTIIQKCLNM